MCFAYRSGDGSSDRSLGGSLDHLRHVQSRQQGDDHQQHSRRQKIRRKKGLSNEPLKNLIYIHFYK